MPSCSTSPLSSPARRNFRSLLPTPASQHQRMARIRSVDATSKSPLFKLPWELRTQVYRYVVTAEYPIHIMRNRAQEFFSDQWIFLQCSNSLRTQSGDCDCDVRNTEQLTLDTSLFFVCKQVRKEAAMVAFTENQFVLGAEVDFTRLKEHFGEAIKHAQRIRLTTFLDDKPLSIYTHRRLDALCEMLPCLRSLVVVAFAKRHRNHNRLFEEGFLNWFRRLSRFPLEHARVDFMYDIGLVDITYQQAVALGKSAESILLRGPDLPEEAQVPLPEDLRIYAERNTKHAAVTAAGEFLSYIPGTIVPLEKWDRID